MNEPEAFEPLALGLNVSSLRSGIVRTMNLDDLRQFDFKSVRHERAGLSSLVGHENPTMRAHSVTTDLKLSSFAQPRFLPFNSYTAGCGEQSRNSELPGFMCQTCAPLTPPKTSRA